MPGVTQKAFAALMDTHQGTVSQWKSRGWIVMDGDLVDVDASKALLLKKRGTLGKMSQRDKRMRSGWSKSPHCETHRAFALQRAWREAQ
jgi:hypothetical protein